MTKRLLCAISILSFCFLYSQIYYKIYYQKKGDTISLFIDNDNPFPYSLEFFGQPKGDNVRITEHLKKRYIIEANASKIKLAEFVALDNKETFAVVAKSLPSFFSSIGNVWKTDYDENYEYDLPYAEKQIIFIMQGYNGNFSHQNKNALDFKIPEGAEVLAAREGFVTLVKQDSNTGCPDESCANDGNFIQIIHSDGTIAEYFHLKFQGAKVKKGDKVEKGQIIGLSGNTGWSTSPHLHFMCYLPSWNGKRFQKKSVKTLFRINNGNKTAYLQEGNYYKKNY